jgi:hypothetical protein
MVDDTSAAGNPGDLITAAELAEYGITPEAVRRRCPWAVEYVGLDGEPCWRREELAPLLCGRGDGP